MGKFSYYWQELRYICTNSADNRTRAALIAHTALFHLNNLAGRPRLTVPFSARIKISKDYELELLLRTFSGDLFVLFEVLEGECYYIPETVLPRKDVGVILDCGANIGITSLYLAARYPYAQIYSIEPDAPNFALLRANTRAEPRITAIHAAVVGEPSQGVRITSSREAWGNHISYDGEGIDVSAMTIKQICELYKISNIDLLKMDIEGAEVDVFANGAFLDRVRFLIAELHGEYGHSNFEADMEKHGLVAARAGELPGVRVTSARR